MRITGVTVRIATGIIAMGLSLVVGVVSFFVIGLSDLANDEQGSTEGEVGLVVALLLFLGSAFAFNLPQVSAPLFLVAGILGIAVSDKFEHLAEWSVAALLLAVMAFLSWVGKRRDRRARSREAAAVAEHRADIDPATAAGNDAATGNRLGELGS